MSLNDIVTYEKNMKGRIHVPPDPLQSYGLTPYDPHRPSTKLLLTYGLCEAPISI